MEQNYQSQFRSQLHSVHKHPFKPFKKPVAPPPPVPPKVYRVDSECFKQVVQELTAAPAYMPRRLKSLAPPPISLSTDTTATEHEKKTTLELLPSPNVTPTWSNIYKELMSEDNLEMPLPHKQSDGWAAFSPLELGLSPTSYGWCSLPQVSPGALSPLEQSVL